MMILANHVARSFVVVAILMIAPAMTAVAQNAGGIDDFDPQKLQELFENKTKGDALLQLANQVAAARLNSLVSPASKTM